MPASSAPSAPPPMATGSAIERMLRYPPLSLALVGAIILSLAYALMLVAADYRRHIEARDEVLARAAEQVRARTQAYFDTYRAAFNALIASDCLHTRDARVCNALFARLNERFPDVINFAATDRDGRFFASGRPVASSTPPSAANLAFYRALANGAPEYVMDPHQGPVSHEMVTGLVVPLRDAQGRFDGLLGISTRFAELSRAWGELNGVPGHAVLVVDRNRRIIHATGAAAKLLGADAATLSGFATLVDRNGERQRLRVLEKEYDALSTSVEGAQWTIVALRPADYGFVDYARQTQLVWQLGLPVLLLAMLGIAMFLREARAIKRLIANEHELREHRDRLEEMVAARTQALGRSEERFRKLVEHALVSISVSRQGRLLYVNDAFCRIFGLAAPAEAIGRPLLDFLPATVHEEIAARNLLRERGEDVLNRYESLGLRADGSQFPFEVAATTIALEDGTGTLAFIQDISARKEAEQLLRGLNEELERRVADRTAAIEQANRELEAFSYSVSHDLRAPLRRIDGFCGMIEADPANQLSEASRAQLARVHSAVALMSSLIDDLLKLARVSRQHMSLEDTDLSACAQSIIADLYERDSARSVETHIEPGLIAHGDPQLLRIVLYNLLENAWKYSARRAQARIEFGCEQQDGQTVYFVRDNGAGFDMRYATQLFGAFQRLHQSSEFAGNGVGLATVARIVDRHGGKIWAAAEVDRGATFYFTLPGAPA